MNALLVLTTVKNVLVYQHVLLAWLDLIGRILHALSIAHMGIWELIVYVRLVLVTVRHVYNLCHYVLHV